MQLIKELSSAAGRCAGMGCALIRQLANSHYTDAEHYMAKAVNIVEILTALHTALSLTLVWKFLCICVHKPYID